MKALRLRFTSHTLTEKQKGKRRPKVEEAYRQFAEAFAYSIVRLDYSAAHKMLAPWLQSEMTPERLRQFVETELKEVAEGFELEEIIYPKAYNVDGNSCSLNDLHK